MSPRQLLRCLPLAAILIAAACSERLDTSNNCPVLCTDNTLVVKDTTLDLVTFDSAYPGFTSIGERWPAPALASSDGAGGFLYETFVPVINRQDSVDVRQVFRFDTLPRTLSTTDTTSIKSVTGSKLLLVVDTSRSLIPSGPTTISLYDVDDSTVTDDSTAAILAARFTPDRFLTSRTFTRADVVADTIPGSGTGVAIRAFGVTIPDSIMLRYITGPRRMHIGVRVTSSTSAALSFVAPSVRDAGLTPRLTYDPSPDTTIKAYSIQTTVGSGVAQPERFKAQSLVLKDLTPLLNDGSLEVGGLTGVRSLLSVSLPRAFLDTVTIIRASLDLVQRPLPTVPGATDGIRLRARVGIAGPSLGGDPRRLVEFLDPTLEGVLLKTRLVAPADSGVKSFEVGDAIRLWITQDSTAPTSFILFSEGEAYQSQRPAFYSRRNPNPALRPRLRVTYTIRREGAIP